MTALSSQCQIRGLIALGKLHMEVMNSAGKLCLVAAVWACSAFRQNALPISAEDRDEQTAAPKVVQPDCDRRSIRAIAAFSVLSSQLE